MDRDTIIRAVAAGAIIIAILFGWKYVEPVFFPPKPAPTATAPAPPAAAKPSAPPAGAKPAAATPEAETPAPGAPAPVLKAPAVQVRGGSEADAAPIVLGSDAYESLYDLRVEVAPKGAAVRQLALSRHDFFKTVKDRNLPADDRAAMELIPPTAPPAFTIPELRLWLRGVEDPVEVDLSQAIWNPVEVETNRNQAVLTVDIVDADSKPLLTVRKTFRISSLPESPEARAAAPPQYEMRMAVEFVPADERVVKVAYVLDGPPGLPMEGGRGSVATAVAGSWAKGSIQVTPAVAKDIKTGEALPETKNVAGPEVAWAGQMDKYFAVVMIPQKPSRDGTFAAGAEIAWARAVHGEQETAMPQVRLLSKELPLAGKPLVNDYAVYAGPKDDALLARCYGDLELTKLIPWATPCFCIPMPGLEYLSKFLVAVLDAFYTLVRNYGLAIILLVLVLRVILHPITRWSTRSMTEMQKLAPKMQEIREKHAGDKEKMQQEMAKIGGFKAFGGCLPMFIQMPIWIALYGTLGVAIQLRHAAFLPPSWLPHGSMFLQDLSGPDALVHWTTPFYLPGTDIPLLGWLIGSIQGMLVGGPGGLTSFNLLPILMGVSMYLQQRLTPTPVAAGPQAQQQKTMMVFMTIFMALVLYSAPSGLNLYIATSTFLGFFEQRYLKKKMEEARTAKESQVPEEVKASAPAKEQLLAASRHQSLIERLRVWADNRARKAKQTEAGRPGTPKSKRGK